MKVWTCNNFTGHWPVGTAAVIAALTREQAVGLLADKLCGEGLSQEIKLEDVEELDLAKPNCVILCNGEY